MPPGGHVFDFWQVIFVDSIFNFVVEGELVLFFQILIIISKKVL